MVGGDGGGRGACLRICRTDDRAWHPPPSPAESLVSTSCHPTGLGQLQVHLALCQAASSAVALRRRRRLCRAPGAGITSGAAARVHEARGPPGPLPHWQVCGGGSVCLFLAAAALRRHIRARPGARSPRGPCPKSGPSLVQSGGGVPAGLRPSSACANLNGSRAGPRSLAPGPQDRRRRRTFNNI